MSELQNIEQDVKNAASEVKKMLTAAGYTAKEEAVKVLAAVEAEFEVAKTEFEASEASSEGAAEAV